MGVGTRAAETIVILSTLLPSLSCTDSTIAPTDVASRAVTLSTSCGSPLCPSSATPQEELFGDVFEAGSRFEGLDLKYKVTLELDPTDAAAYQARGGRMNFGTDMLVFHNDDTDSGWGWYVDQSGQNPIPGNNSGICNGGPEVHYTISDDAIQPPTGNEIHCVDPGQFIVTLRKKRTFLPGWSVEASRNIDFISIHPTPTEEIELPGFPTGESYLDNVVHFDLTGTSYSVNKSVTRTASGAVGDTFQFSASSSSTTWNHDTKGELSVAWLWDTFVPEDQSSYTNTVDWNEDTPVVRVHVFEPLHPTGTRQGRALFLTPSTAMTAKTKDFPFLLTPSAGPASISITPGDSIRAMIGDTVILSATVLSAAGDTLTGAPVSWSENNPVIYLEPVGEQSAIVTSPVISNTTVSATSEGITDNVPVQFANGLCTTFSIGDSVLQQPPSGFAIFFLHIIQLYFCKYIVTPTQEYRVFYGDGTSTNWISDPDAVLMAEHMYATADTFDMIIQTRHIGDPQSMHADTFMVIVEPEETGVASIGLTPSTATLPPGQTVRLTATPRDAGGVVVPGAVVSWSTNNSNVSVTPLGSDPHKADVTSSVETTATITASAGSASGSSSVHFNFSGSCPSIHHVQVTVSQSVIAVGEDTDLQAIPKDAADNSLATSGCSISWSGSSQVSVNQDAQYPYLAVATGVTSGTATVTADVDGVQGSVQVSIGVPSGGDNAQPYGTGNSFPPTMYQNQFYAVTVYMENTGGTTWTTADYRLGKVSGQGFEPLIVQPSQNVPPGDNHAFSFNLYNEALWGQAYDVEYQMRNGGTFFGQANGRWIDVLDPAGCTKNCGPSAMLESPDRAVPGGGLWGDIGHVTLTEREHDGVYAQTLIVENFPLHFQEVNGQQVAYIRYFGELGQPWKVNVAFRIKTDPGTIIIGQAVKDQALGQLRLNQRDAGLLAPNLRESVVSLDRLTTESALPAGKRTLLEIPVYATPGTEPPSTLPYVELTVVQE